MKNNCLLRGFATGTGLMWFKCRSALVIKNVAFISCCTNYVSGAIYLNDYPSTVTIDNSDFISCGANPETEKKSYGSIAILSN